MNFFLISVKCKKRIRAGNWRLLCFSLPLWYNPGKVVINMEPKEILLELRTRNRLSQEQLAEQVHVTRQAVSRWETGVSLR